MKLNISDNSTEYPKYFSENIFCIEVDKRKFVNITFSCLIT